MLANQEFSFETADTLFSPNQFDSGSRLLLDSVTISTSAKTILDIGCGWGGMGIVLAKMHPNKFVFLVDNDPTAIEISKQNIMSNNISNAKVFKADVTYSTLPQKFDIALANPPWTKNVSVNPALVKFAYDNLNPNGIFAVVINKTFRMQDEMEKIFGNVDVISEHSSYKILRSIKSKRQRNDFLDETIDLIKSHKIILDPLKSQYFLTDSQIVRDLIHEANIQHPDTVLEIGPGLGIITQELAKVAGKVEAVEIDKKFSPILNKLPSNVHLIFEDFFKVFKAKASAPKFNKIVSNVPFTTAGPILLKLKNYDFELGVFILPHKFAQRILDGELKEFYQAKKLFDVPRYYFFPMPEGDSVAVLLKRVGN